MSFLDSNPDLTGTILTPENLRGAQNYLKRLISSLDPKWLAKPKGQLRFAWNDSGQSGITSLIDLASNLATIEESVTARSLPIFEDKVRQLLRANRVTDFDNLLTELRVLSFFAHKKKPIELDPLVSQEELTLPHRPKTPDLSFQVPSGRVFVEITVFYFQPLVLWKSNVEQAFHYIQRSMLKYPVRRILTISIPLHFTWSQTKDFFQSTVIPGALAVETGETFFTLSERQITVTWRKLPHIQADLSKYPAPSAVDFPNDRYATFNGLKGLGLWVSQVGGNATRLISKGQSAIALEATIQPEDATELLVRSIRNTLDRKREQLRTDDINIIVCKIAHHELTSPEVLSMVQDRIWPNTQYRWLNGILLYVPRTGFAPNDNADQMYALMNPNSTLSVDTFSEFMSLNYVKVTKET